QSTTCHPRNPSRSVSCTVSSTALKKAYGMSPGGCVVAQPWGYGADIPGVQKALSAGTRCYGLYANPKSGNQGSAAVDGVVVEWDTHPGGGNTDASEPAEEILRAYLLQGHAEAELCARAGLLLPDSRSITGTPDLWVKLPDGDHWS
ncbi:hypothetical protein AB0K48_51680, partial [Nonomuraea sp. NPDC055795]